MTTSIASLLGVFALLAGCTDDSSELAGDYETVSVTRQADGCGGARADEAVPDNLRWFRLSLVDTDAGTLLGYYMCFEPGSCSTDYDAYRSFGTGPDGWLTTIATAIEPGCTLQYRERTLASAGDTTIRIDDLLYRDIDPALSGDACSIEEARMRGTAMPCVEETVYLAEIR